MKKYFSGSTAIRIACVPLLFLCSFLTNIVNAQQLIYAKSLSNPSPVGGVVENRGLAVDAAGNRYVTGDFTSSADFDPGTGTQQFTAAGGYDIFLAKYDAAGNYLWANRIGATGNDIAFAVAVDGAGNSYVTGYFTGTVDFDPGSGTANLFSVTGTSDIFLAKYDAAGNYVWAKSMGGSGVDEALALTIDASGNLYLTGYFASTVDFDPGTGVQNLTSAGSSDIFVGKYDASGNYLWAKRIGGTADDQGYAIAVDGSGNCFFTGYFASTNTDFDPGTGTQNLSSAGSSDIFLARFDGAGNYVWANKIGGLGIEQGDGVAVDASGNCFITGYFFSTNVDFDPGTGTQILSNASSSADIFFAKYDGSGNYVWAKKIGGTGSDQGYGIGTDAGGNCYITGTFIGTNIDFDPGAGFQNLSASGTDIYVAKYDASGNYAWAKKAGNTGSDIGYALAIDGSDNCHTAGIFQNAVDFDPDAGIATLTAGGSANNGYVWQLNSAGSYVSAIALGGYNNSILNDMGVSIKIDGSGNTYVTGFFSGTVDFDPGTGTQYLTAAGSTSDVFLAKYDAAGNYVWAKRIGGSGDDKSYSLALDGSGNCYLTGAFYSTDADFDPGTGTATLSAVNGSADIFLAKYDGSGNYVWAKSISGTSSDMGLSIAADAAGNCYVTGYFYGTNVDFDPGTGTQNLNAVGSGDIFLAKYDASGNYVWAKSMGGTNTDAPYALAVDALGNCYITGYFSSTNADFDPGTGTATLSTTGSSTDIFLAKYDGSGNYLWAKKMGGTGTDQSTAIALDGSGNCYITGSFTATVNFDPAGTQNLTAVGNNDIFLAKYSASGNYIWAKSMGGTNADLANSLTIDAMGNSYITGYFYGTANFDPATGTQNLVSAGANDIFLAKYDVAGNYVAALRMGGTGADQANAIAIDAAGNSYLTGYFSATADFDPGAGTQNLTTLNGYDVFIGVYAPLSVLPIQLESFGGELINNDAAMLLRWTTASEENFAYFEVERSPNGKNLTSIGRVAGCASCNGHQQYSFTDYQPLTGKSYYRLKMIDVDGKAQYSKWISVQKNEGNGVMRLYPTVTNGPVTVFHKISGTTRNIHLSIYNEQGKIIQHKQLMLAAGNNHLAIDLSGQAPGVYYVQLKGLDEQASETATVILR